MNLSEIHYWILRLWCSIMMEITFVVKQKKTKQNWPVIISTRIYNKETFGCRGSIESGVVIRLNSSLRAEYMSSTCMLPIQNNPLLNFFFFIHAFTNKHYLIRLHSLLCAYILYSCLLLYILGLVRLESGPLLLWFSLRFPWDFPLILKEALRTGGLVQSVKPFEAAAVVISGDISLTLQEPAKYWFLFWVDIWKIK